MSQNMGEAQAQNPVGQRPAKKQARPDSKRGRQQQENKRKPAIQNDTKPKQTYKEMKEARERQAGTAPRPSTRGERNQASRVRRQEEAHREHKRKNRERVIAGKEAKPDAAEKPSIWEKTAERKVYHQLREMGDTSRNIDKFQKKRVMSALFFALLGCAAGYFIHPWLYMAGPIVGFFMYKMKAKQVDTYYRGWKFERQLNFSKFTRLVIPYLKASGGNTALYTIFNKILQRTDNEADRRSLYQLMGEMGDNPSDLKPFTDYAERSSGTDMSHLFMSTIFDFQQSTFDTTVIDELGEMAAEDMMNAIDEIIAMKLRRFVMFPTKVVMSSFILVAGLGVGMMIHNFKDIGFGGDMLSPMEAAENAETSQDGGEAGAASQDSDDVQTEDEQNEDASAMSEAEKSYMENNYQELEGREKDSDTPDGNN